MAKTKAWDWSINEDQKWLIPCVESAWLAERWQSEGKACLLDLGCGLGRHSVYFAQKGFEVTASDLSDYGISHVEEWAGRLGVPVQTTVCDMTSIPFPDGSFDCMLAYNVIYHTDTAGFRAVLAELFRVLKPGGELFLTLLSKRSPGFVEAKPEQYVDENTIVRTDCEETERGIPHFYMDAADVSTFFKDWVLAGPFEECTEYLQGGGRVSGCHWKLLFRKPE